MRRLWRVWRLSPGPLGDAALRGVQGHRKLYAVRGDRPLLTRIKDRSNQVHSWHILKLYRALKGVPERPNSALPGPFFLARRA
jgi:hypothetical protein